MTRFYEISVGAVVTPYKTLKALCEDYDLEGEYDNILYKINKKKPWTNGEVVVVRKYFKDAKKE